MRVVFVPPTEEDFTNLFSSVPLRKGGGLDDINIFQPYTLPSSSHRKGGGIFSLISSLARKVLPFLFKAAKPAAKEFGSSVLQDVIRGDVPIKRSLKKHGINALKDTGVRLLKGSGRITKARRVLKKNRARTGMKKKKKKRITIKKKKKKKSTGYKRDIFSMI